MAGPVESYIVLPDDSGNTGKKQRAQQQSVGGNTVYVPFYVPSRQANLLAGGYRAAMAQVTAAASAQNGTSTGALWATNPTATVNKWVRLRRILVSAQHATALATPTAPRLNITRMTFTGTPSGASVTACKANSGDPAPVLDLRTAVTGLTPSLVASCGLAPFAGALTAVGAYAPGMIEMVPTSGEDDWTIYKPGEGFVIYQDTAGTSSDTRVVNIVLLWDEIDVS